MARVTDAFQWICTNEDWTRANELANIRIRNEYRRDVRLNIPQRIEKIAIGYIGEFAFQQWCRINGINIEYFGEVIRETADDGDFGTESQQSLDVKTQEVLYMPEDNWRCEVTSEQINRPIDLYVFTKLYKTITRRTVYICGWMTHTEFRDKCTLHSRGTILRGRPVHYDKYDVLINQLNDLNSLRDFLRPEEPNSASNSNHVL